MNKAKVDPFDRYKHEYWKASRKRKGEIIAMIKELTNLHPKSIVRTFRRLQTKSLHTSNDRGTPTKYGADVTAALKDVWELSNELCAVLLHSSVSDLIKEFEEAHAWHHSDVATGLLRGMSLATMKRRVAAFVHIRTSGHGITTTKPAHIKFIVQVFTGPWKDKPFGYCQADTVVHSGTSLSGNMAHTVNLSETHVLWIALRAQMNKGEVVTRESLEHMNNEMLPFPLVGIHPDTGSEFLNWHLKGWCDAHRIEFTRSRSGEKNDNMIVEERNGHVVRKIIGYIRIDCQEAVDALNELYHVECLIHNHFTPVRLTIAKEKVGARYRRTYDTPKTPYQRILDRDDVSPERKERLRAEHETLSLVRLRKESDRLKKKVYDTQRRYGTRMY